MLDIHQHITKGGISFYRCSPSQHTSFKNSEVPAWMFDKIKCSKMKLLTMPYCSLETLHQLLLLLNEASLGECIIDKSTAFTEQGDGHVKSQPGRKNNHHAAIRRTQSTSKNMEKLQQSKSRASKDLISQNNDSLSHRKDQKEY